MLLELHLYKEAFQAGFYYFYGMLSQHTLTILFAKDQQVFVDKVIYELVDSSYIINHSKTETEAPDLVKYEIEFKSNYGIYLFGFMQVSLIADMYNRNIEGQSGL